MRVDLRRKKSNPIWWIKYEWNQEFCGKNLSCLGEFLSSVSNALESLHKEHGVTFPKAPSVHGQIEFGGRIDTQVKFHGLRMELVRRGKS